MKRILSITLALVMLFSLTTFASSDVEDFKVITPEEESSSSQSEIILISGKAKRDTVVTIQVYGALNTHGNNYSLKNLPKEDEYILVSEKNIKSGPLGFGEEIKLIKGINKIVISFDVDGVEEVTRVIYHYDAEELKTDSRRKVQ